MKAQAPSRTAAPAAALLSLEDAKAHLRVESTDDDAYITGLISAATSYFDGYSGILGQALITQTWRQRLDGFPAGSCLRLPVGPLLAISSIAYYDAAGDSQAFTDYLTATDEIGPLIVLEDGATWPTTSTRPDAVTVTWSCGFGGDAGYVPGGIVLAAKLLIGHWYANRETVNVGNIVSELPFTVQALINPHRKVGL